MPKLIDELKSVKLFGVEGHRLTPLGNKFVLIEGADGKLARIFKMADLHDVDINKIDLNWREINEQRT
jgi:hypothetical protein